MLGLVIIVVLGTTVIVGTTLGGRYRVAPPVLLLCFGGLLAMLPGLTDIELDPDVVLLLFLPAILYWESINTSLREIRANLRVVVLYSVVLVIVTAATVSFTAQALGIDPHAAWVLGAVLAPTDAAAVGGLARQLPRRTLTTLRAESLINDGTALVMFTVAVDAATGGASPGPLELVARFLGSYGGGIVAGLLTSGAVIMLRKRLDDPLREGALSVLTPFVAFLLAEVVHASGIVAVVVAGLVLAYASPRIVRARSRLQVLAFWDLSTFLLNGGLFVFVGMQFPQAVRGLGDVDFAYAMWVALTITGVVIGTRMVWTHLATAVVRTLDRRPAQRLRRVGWRQRTAASWVGFRGAVSLAAVLAVPVTADGAPFPDRSLMVFTTCVVILLTIVVQGTTLPAVVRWARFPEDEQRGAEVLLARQRATEAALVALPEIAERLGVDGDRVARLRVELEDHARVVGDRNPHPELDVDRQLRLAILDTKRAVVTDLRDANEIDDIVLREVQASLDLEEVRLLGPPPSD